MFETVTAARVAFATALLTALAPCQTTQGIVRVRVISLRDGAPVSGCAVRLLHVETNANSEGTTAASGEYAFAQLSPGTYEFRAEAAGYQAQEAHALTLRVAGTLLITVPMRPLEDVWEDNYRKNIMLPGASVLVIYGPDVDTSHTGQFEASRGAPGALEATVSQVIDTRLLNALPLPGRDAYTLLVTQPGVTANSTTFRSLGLSVNGQRPSASSFLLDGIENNDPLVTGPLSPLAPEALQEYRISTNNFSAAYGRTSGFVANAVTRSGAKAWHGMGWFYGRHEKLMARGFAEHDTGDTPFREWEPGGFIGGPLWKQTLFGAAAGEWTGLRTRAAPAEYLLPSAAFIEGLGEGTIARDLLTRFRPDPALGRTSGLIEYASPDNINRLIAMPRVDWVGPKRHDRLFARLALFRLSRPDMFYSPYRGFSLPLRRDTSSLAIGYVRPISPVLVSETRAGLSFDSFSAERPHPEIPQMIVIAPDEPHGEMAVPGSDRPYSYSNRSRNIELTENVTRAGKRHVATFGGGLLFRKISGELSTYAAGSFLFYSPQEFANDAPGSVTLGLQRGIPVVASVPNPARVYAVHDWYAFAQDSIRITGRLTASLGLRYDRYGAPVNVGAVKDMLLTLPPAQSPGEALANATFGSASSRDQRLFRTDGQQWAPRLGLSWALDSEARTLVRAGYGIYYDRLFDNFWQTVRNNSVAEVTASLEPVRRVYLDLPSLLSGLPRPLRRNDFPEVTLFPDAIHPARVHSGFAGVQRAIGARMFVEVNALASKSSHLPATDRWNREYSVTERSDDNRLARFNGALPDVLFRGDQGRADYRALTVLTRRTTRQATWQVSYTLSRTRDNQSDPIAGEFFELGFSGTAPSAQALFARQFDPSGDWGGSDFDQRHNLVLFGAWELPRMLSGWQLSGVAAARSGFPFTVTNRPDYTNSLRRIPADLVNPDRVWADRQSAGAGVRLLNADAFAPVTDRLGNSGRNAFHGPGLFNFDASLSRRFPLAFLSDLGRLTIRGDVFNVLNHANLNNPVADLSQPDFGIATRGRLLSPNAFRVFGPLRETGRQVQVMLRVEF